MKRKTKKPKPIASDPNPDFDPLADLKTKCAELINLIEGPDCRAWVGMRPGEPGVRLRDMPEWCAFFVSARRLWPE